MRRRRNLNGWFSSALASVYAAIVVFASGIALVHAGSVKPLGADAATTKTPIKHLIVIVGENHSFDNLFATYKPKSGQSIWNLRSENKWNLRSENIVTDDGNPGSIVDEWETTRGKGRDT
jgi:phospholipase C